MAWQISYTGWVYSLFLCSWSSYTVNDFCHSSIRILHLNVPTSSCHCLTCDSWHWLKFANLIANLQLTFEFLFLSQYLISVLHRWIFSDKICVLNDVSLCLTLPCTRFFQLWLWPRTGNLRGSFSLDGCLHPRVCPCNSFASDTYPLALLWVHLFSYGWKNNLISKFNNFVTVAAIVTVELLLTCWTFHFKLRVSLSSWFQWFSKGLIFTSWK